MNVMSMLYMEGSLHYQPNDSTSLNKAVMRDIRQPKKGNLK